MRSRVFALLAAAIGLALIPVAAEAGHRRHHYDGVYGRHHPNFYHRHYRSDWRYDPYAYSYTPRRYYPYYNSGYWRPTYELRYRRACCRPVAELPPYYRAWGYPTRHYVKRSRWHRDHYRRWK